MTAVTHEYRYKAQGPTLARFIADRSRRGFIDGPLGSGKTNASCYKCFNVMIGQLPGRDGVRRTRLAAVRNTYPDLLTTTARDWLDAYGDLGSFSQGGMEPPCHDVWFQLEDGSQVKSELFFIALDRPSHVRKLRGLQLTAAWLNEVKELSKSTLDMIDLRVGRFQPDGFPCTWYGVFGDTNKPDTDHWLYELAEETKPPGFTFFHQPGALMKVNGRWVMNPLAENVQNLPGREQYYLDGMSGKREDWIRVNLANEYGFVQDGKPIYEEYIDDVHCREFALVPGIPLHVGLDFGLTPAATISQRMRNGQWRTRFEVVTYEMGATNFARELGKFIRERCPPNEWEIAAITGDPAGNERGNDEDESTVFQILAAEKIYAKPASTNEYSIRRDAIGNTMLRLIDGEPGYLVHPDCKVLRKAHQGAYCYRRLQVAGMDRFKDAPDKNPWSHVAEAEQYGILGAGEGRVVIGKSRERNHPRPAVASGMDVTL